jgi:hypothetical protein
MNGDCRYKKTDFSMNGFAAISLFVALEGDEETDFLPIIKGAERTLEAACAPTEDGS